MVVIRTTNISLRKICLGIKRRMDYTGVVAPLVAVTAIKNLDL